jgi:hypothetical protein
MAKTAGGDVLDKEQAEKVLYSGAGLPGGGQLEIRMEISADHPDPDIRAVARRVKFFNLESWHTQWIQVAEKNEQLAAEFEQERTQRDGPRVLSARCRFLSARARLFARNRPAYAAELPETQRDL